MNAHVGIALIEASPSCKAAKHTAIDSGSTHGQCCKVHSKSEEEVMTAQASSAESLFIYCTAVMPTLAFLQKPFGDRGLLIVVRGWVKI